MAQYARCSRDSMYASPMAGLTPLVENEPLKGNTSEQQVSQEANGDNQKPFLPSLSNFHPRLSRQLSFHFQGFNQSSLIVQKSTRRRNNRKWKKLDLVSEPAQADWGEQPTFQFPEAASAATKPAREPASSSLHPDPTDPTKEYLHANPPSRQRQTLPPDAHPRPKNYSKRRRGRKMNPAKVAGSEYIPPHLRNKKLPSVSLEVKSVDPTQTANGTPSGVTNSEVTNPNQQSNAPKATSSSGPTTVVVRAKPAEVAPTQQVSTPQQQSSVARATSSSRPPTGTTNGFRPKSPPSPPSSPPNEEDEPKSGTLIWRRWKEPTPEQSKQVSFDASNGHQPKGIQQSRWNNRGGRTGPSMGKPTNKAVQQSNWNNDNGWGAPNADQQSNWNNGNGWGASNAVQQPDWNNVSRSGRPANQKAQGGNSKPPRTRWPKNREMKAVPVDEESDGGISFKSNSNGDPDYDVKKLLDWEGKWMAPPEVWSGRNSFRDRHFGDHIEQWINGGELKGCDKLIMDINPAEFLADPNGELVPRSWIPTQIENGSPQEFWRDFPSRAPAPLSDVDLTELKPFWELYPNGTSSYLPPLEVPVAQIDRSEEDNCLPGTKLTSEKAVKKKEEAANARYRRIMEKRNRPTNHTLLRHAPEPPDLSLKPTANIYLRPVQPADVPQITDLYNHYVKTICANEFNNRTAANMANRLSDITTGGLPWIVAIEKGNHLRKQHFKFVNEKIVGFSSMDDHCDQGGMYRYTFEMEMYVHPEHLRQGIGKCLLDKMLELVDNGYRSRGGYEWSCQGDYLKNGSTRVVKSVNVIFPHENGVTSEVDWVAAFLKSFEFRKSGHLHNMGYKNGKVVDTTIFQHFTAEQIDPNLRPSAPL
ncbi:hypothetical protein K505DRAFT_375151 [Melanomma pulvis-pyrius CBS 109.77]|uniref:N-acetyltransferase domain-containing protein n=1 Tax=Melanomma pulvis-pyrius CBS 109.77 TaxID=1314802 RepID=A0A6A6XDC9_9PLEO|nr:hypothetical protein K505DRAFT_375151 [Melanomma pulvis-pyrius CBS 109.77]